ncbi:two-component system sensor histidine kinase YesM [Paenibacillus turicensis]|uniref:Two-component system sensor histidine kinase YesM n=1 Tax=Paenibacillus turicensis TaxID=160487 RepID=A0ABS4FNW6_9BACL|nr:sensor histidine kinase [Paenibacillus turicensis]MBP1904231.1 two-component system sensor histidine kinase YesM [Paenibacillus turicensis]
MIKAIVQLTNNLKLKHKLFALFVLVVLIPILIIGGGITYYFSKEATDRAISQASNDVQKIKNQLASLFRVPISISNTLMVDKALKKVVTTNYTNVSELTNAYLDYKEFPNYKRLYREITGIRFYVNNPTLINNTEIIPTNPSIVSQNWYKSVMDRREMGWFYVRSSEDTSIDSLSLVRQLSFPDYRVSGVIMISLKQEELNRLLLQEQFDTIIMDEQGFVVAAKNKEWVGLKQNQLHYGIDLSKQKIGVHQLDIEGKSSYMFVEQLIPGYSMNGLKIISFFNTSSIIKESRKVSLFGLVLILLVLIIATFFVYTVSFLTSNRLLRLSRHLNRLALGDLSVVSRIDGNDEIGQLSRQFNYMVHNINALMQQVVEKTEQNNKLELAQREIKLKMMASQINPHFLFNALESIRMSAHLKGEKEIANVVRLLGKLMRKNLEIGREYAPLKEEIEMINSYLHIQKFRYEERLNFELDVDPALLNMLLPPLAIQPLVENAVVHGLENKPEGVTVKLQILADSDIVTVKVSDDGLGITPERLEEVQQLITDQEEPTRSRIGLRNVHQRLVMCYGEQAGLQIWSVYGKGTKISFNIPRSENK